MFSIWEEQLDGVYLIIFYFDLMPVINFDLLIIILPMYTVPYWKKRIECKGKIFVNCPNNS